MPSVAMNDLEAPVAPSTEQGPAPVNDNGKPREAVGSPTEQGPVNGSVKHRAVSKLHEFKEQLLLLSTLVATVTYVAGLNLPGGSWEQDEPGGHMAGDPILRDTHYRRYIAFYYCNATALAASLVVSLILIIQEKKKFVWTVVLRMVMVLDLLSLMGAYGAGSCRDAFTTIYAAVTFFLVALITISVFFYLRLNGVNPNPNHDPTSKSIPDSNPDTTPNSIFDSNLNPDSTSNSISNSNLNPVSNPNSNNIPKPNSWLGAGKRIRKQNSVVKRFDLTDSKKQEKEQIDVLMLLATFAVTITYVAGLSPPGGFWSSTQDGHRLSDPVLQARGRYRAFFVCNTTSFAVSLLTIVLLLEKKLLKNKLLNISVRFTALYGLIAVALLGLMGAYAAGSCREADNTIFVLTLAAAVPVCVCLQLALVSCWKKLGTTCDRILGWFKAQVNTPRGTSIRKNKEQHIQNTRYLVMLLATLVVTITYQAGLDPPGGLWLDSRDGHTIGHPVLQTTHPTRYQVFFYSNSAAFVTSLVVIMMLQSKYLLTRHTLEAALVLDLFGLVTSYGAGSTRDVNASFYIIALAGIVLVYVIVHITIIDHAPEPEGGDATVKDLDEKRKVLLLVAILAATLTYQAGLTPPGGFWLADDLGLSRHAGSPVLLANYPRRYYAFFYSNAASFMASVTLILLLVNPKLYRPGIRSYALYVCMLVSMFGLMGAYVAGSSRHLSTSIYVLLLVVSVLALIGFLVAIFWFFCKNKFEEHDDRKVQEGQNNGGITNNNNKNDSSNGSSTDSGSNGSSNDSSNNNSNESSNSSSNDNITSSSNGNSSSKNNSSSNSSSNDNITSSSNGNSSSKNNSSSNDDDDNDNNHGKERLEYLMLLGILGASMTYQTGLKPPGGLWQDNTDGHSAGNPILHDINKHRYNAFFYSNSTSFMASIVVVVMLLPLTIKKYRVRNLPLWPMHTAILLDMISLLVAYAAGSTRKWATSRNVMFLIIPVLLYIAVYVTASIFYHRKDPPVAEPPTLTPTPSTPNEDAK